MGFGSFFSNPITAVASALNPVGLIGTGLAVGGEVFSAIQQKNAIDNQNVTNRDIASQQMLFSADQARQLRDWQTDMSNSEITRRVADMRRAGINPMLAAGDGASTPGGAVGQSAGIPAQAAGLNLSPALTSARDTLSLIQNVLESNSRIAKNRVDADSNWARSESAAEVNEQDKRLRMKQNEILDNELRIRRASPTATGLLDLFGGASGLSSMGSSAASIGRMLAE